MATIIPSTGAISASYIETYLGGNPITGANVKLSYDSNSIPTPPNFALNQIFFARPDSVNTWSGQMNYLSLRGRCFGIYTSSSRTAIHGNSFIDRSRGLFTGFFGFGTTKGGTSGILNSINQGFPIGIRIDTILGRSFGITLRVYDETGRWISLPFATPTIEIIGNYSAISLDVQYGYAFELQLSVWPAKNGNTLSDGNGVHTMNLTLEFPADPISSSSEPIKIRR